MAGGHGGRRLGAGRPPASPHRRRAAEIRAQAIAEHKTPLEFFIREMNNESNDLEFRALMAQSAAPYMHCRLSAIATTTLPPRLSDDGKVIDITPDAPHITEIRILPVEAGTYISDEQTKTAQELAGDVGGGPSEAA
jgi:hypothetical protein